MIKSQFTVGMMRGTGTDVTVAVVTVAVAVTGTEK
jgi:hypothetical protein